MKRIPIIPHFSNFKNFPETDRLHYAAKDAERFAQTIESQTGVPFPHDKVHDNVHVLLDQDATLLGIQDGIAWLAGLPNADTVYVFFSGHGLFDRYGQAYLIPYDGYKDNPMRHGYRADIFLSDLKHIRAKTLVVFVDACHAAQHSTPEQLRAQTTYPALS